MRKKQNRIEVSTFWVLFFTLIAIGWYTYETARLRMATEEQIKRSYMPVVVLEFKGKQFVNNEGYDLHPTLRNVGFGPAFNIEVSSIENEGYRTDFDLVPGLGKDAEYELLPFALENHEGEQAIEGFGKLLTTIPAGRTIIFNTFPVTITFLDAKGDQHKLTQEIQVWIEKHEVKAIVKSMPSLD